ncbi:carbohydrate ABC transporter permease [Winogradskya humida]|uniref:ABC transporter permease n=1 Tax=Winogradskya humida TaxID=113566 RepID=A0ABQ4A7I7_9ACTN|nr:sugar ABC transporter permease [Actinoplanes humidus]GIE26789.1 ABC transporter permease [Actinoplanes humidus]
MATVTRRLGRHWYAWSMVAPVVIVLTVLVLVPLGRGLYLSLTDANESTIGRTIGPNHIPSTYEFVGLDNYWHVLSGAEGHFYQVLTWTVVWTIACVVLHYVLGLGLALMLNQRARFRAGYRIMLILPWAVPAFVSAFAWRLLLNGDRGIVNQALASAGLSGVQWLADPLWQKVSVIAVNVWLGVPFMMVALLGGLQSIPAEQYEAAEMDGASAWQRFTYVTLPGLRPISSTVVLLGSIWTFNQFPVIFLLVGGDAGADSQILVTYAYRLAFAGVRDYSGAATYGALILLLLLVFAVVYRRRLAEQDSSLRSR